MPVTQLTVESQTYDTVNSLRNQLDWTWEGVFHNVVPILKAELGRGYTVPRDVGDETTEALRRRAGGCESDGDSEVVVLTKNELGQRLTDAKADGRQEGYESALQEKRQEIQQAVVDAAYCRRCQIREAGSMHHLVPRSYGGGDGLKNLVPLCDSCHDRVEVLTERLMDSGCDRGVGELRGYVENGFPLEVY